MNCKEILTNNSEWVKKLDVGACIECCYSCSYRELRSPLDNNEYILCMQVRDYLGSEGSCQRFKHYELYKNNS